jgi:hypothetical protein
MPHQVKLAFMLASAFSISALAQNSNSQNSNSQNKTFDVQSSVGDLHVGDDADARKIGLPLYPGARLKTSTDKDGDSNQANLSLFTKAFGFKLVVANYDSDDAPAKVIDFYRDKLKKYGKVLECHSQKGGGDVDVHNDDDDSNKGKALKCQGDNTGPVTELKIGTEDDQHIVAIEPSDSGKGSTFALVYVRTRGKKGEI